MSVLPAAIEALPIACADGTNRPARETMAHAAFVSGMALANSGLGVAHGVAAAMGVHAGVPHGLACAVMLPSALRVNRQVSEEKLARIGELLAARAFTSRTQAADFVIERIDRLAEELAIPRRLSQLGVSREQLPALVAGAHGNSLNGNPRELGDEELFDLLERML
jgi:alcohol dehydrogenase class IV